MKKGKLSINDIASKLDISKTTVSFILNGKAKEKRISDELTKKVLELVNEVGYRPNQFAQSLRTGKTNILGLMIEDISNPFFSNIAKNIEEKAFKNGYKIIYCSTENDPKRAKEFIKMFYNLGVDGYILTPPNGIEEDINWLVENGENVILFDRYFDDIPADYVMVNNEESTYTGTNHLISQGYSEIAFITIEMKQPQMLGRLKGYQKAVKENGLNSHIHALPFHKDYTQYTQEVIEILKKNQIIDAIVFSANYLGVGGIEAITQMGLRIPQDLAVISFDDNDLFRVSKPTITAISQPIEQISETIITSLLDRINASIKKLEQKENNEIILPTSLIIRESSARKYDKQIHLTS